MGERCLRGDADALEARECEGCVGAIESSYADVVLKGRASHPGIHKKSCLVQAEKYYLGRQHLPKEQTKVTCQQYQIEES